MGLKERKWKRRHESHGKQEGIESLANIDSAFTACHTVLGPGDTAANKVGRAPASGSHSGNEEANKY